MVALVSKPELAAAVTALFVAVAVAGVLSYRLYIARHPTRRRAAFDIGSGATKLLVADVAGGLISARLLEENIPIAYKTDAQHNGGHLSNEIQEQGLALLGRLVEAARGLGAVEACAIATEVFRTAPNGDDFLERIRVKTGLEVRIIDQAAEAALGLATAEALGAGGRPSWDSGGGSFQITARGASDGNGEMRSFTGRQGTLTALVLTLLLALRSPLAVHVSPLAARKASTAVAGRARARARQTIKLHPGLCPLMKRNRSNSFSSIVQGWS